MHSAVYISTISVNYSLAYTLSTVMVHIIIVAMHVECWSLEIRPVLITLTRKIADYEIAAQMDGYKSRRPNLILHHSAYFSAFCLAQ